jgi:hypothetical protein
MKAQWEVGSGKQKRKGTKSRKLIKVRWSFKYSYIARVRALAIYYFLSFEALSISALHFLSKEKNPGFGPTILY